MTAIVDDRVTFWLPLVLEQGRGVDVRIGSGEAFVDMASGDAVAVIDALLENVLSHTPEGTPICVCTEIGDEVVRISIEDAGPGFSDASVVGRGISSGDSTGLGLDIVRRAVEASNGSITIGESALLGGASVVLHLPIVAA